MNRFEAEEREAALQEIHAIEMEVSIKASVHALLALQSQLPSILVSVPLLFVWARRCRGCIDAVKRNERRLRSASLHPLSCPRARTMSCLLQAVTHVKLQSQLLFHAPSLAFRSARPL